MREPDPVQGLLHAVDGREVPLEGLVVPVLVDPVPALGQLDAQVFFDAGDEVGLALADEARRRFPRVPVPSRGRPAPAGPTWTEITSESTRTPSQSKTTRSKGSRSAGGRSHSAMVASRSRSCGDGTRRKVADHAAAQVDLRPPSRRGLAAVQQRDRPRQARARPGPGRRSPVPGWASAAARGAARPAAASSAPTTAASTGPASAACAVASKPAGHPGRVGGQRAAAGTGCFRPWRGAPRIRPARQRTAGPRQTRPHRWGWRCRRDPFRRRPPWALRTCADSPAASRSVPPAANRAQAAARIASARAYQRVRPVTA